MNLTLADATQRAITVHYEGLRRKRLVECFYRELVTVFPDRTLDTLTPKDIKEYAEWLAENGLQPASVYAHVSAVRQMFRVSYERLGWRSDEWTKEEFAAWLSKIKLPGVPKKRKWWLNPDLKPKVLDYFATAGEGECVDFVNWTTTTGLRIEETLRCERSMFHGIATDKVWLLVPGTKTNDAQREVPLNAEGCEIANRRLALNPRLFTMPYHELAGLWNDCRTALGIDHPSATLKALRRSYARQQAGKGTPSYVLQKLMGHASFSTTLEYLRLTGGEFTRDELEKYR